MLPWPKPYLTAGLLKDLVDPFIPEAFQLVAYEGFIAYEIACFLRRDGKF